MGTNHVVIDDFMYTETEAINLGLIEDPKYQYDLAHAKSFIIGKNITIDNLTEKEIFRKFDSLVFEEELNEAKRELSQRGISVDNLTDQEIIYKWDDVFTEEMSDENDEAYNEWLENAQSNNTIELEATIEVANEMGITLN